MKPRVYATIGIPEYWRFDPSGGEHHGAPMSGGMLRDGVYHPVELTTEPDGVLKGFSEVMGLYLCWDDGWPRFYDPDSGSYLENWWQERAAREAERIAREVERAAHEAESAAHQTERAALLAENERLRELIRRLQAEG